MSTTEQVEAMRATTLRDFEAIPSPHEPSRRQLWMAIAGGTLVLLAVGLVNSLADEITILDRILLSSFVVFATGFSILVTLFVVMTILGHIDLPQVLQEKPSGSPKNGVSLSRLQAFLWTLVILTAYFHRAVTSGEPGLPAMPADLLMVMGISSAVYLTSKGIAARGEKR